MDNGEAAASVSWVALDAIEMSSVEADDDELLLDDGDGCANGLGSTSQSKLITNEE